MDARRESQTSSADEQSGLPRRKSSLVRNHLDRELFNIHISAGEFRRLAKDREEQWLDSKRRCSGLLFGGQDEEAWRVAEDAIRAQNEASLYVAASEKLRAFHDMIDKSEEIEASMQNIITRVDRAVRGFDPAGALEELKWLESEASEELGPLLPNDDQVRYLLAELKARNELTQALKGERASPGGSRAGLPPSRKSRTHVPQSTSQTPIRLRAKKRNSRKQKGWGQKEVRFRIMPEYR